MSNFIRVAALNEIPEDTGRRVEVDGQEIALFRQGSAVFALYNVCPHAGGPLAEGGIREGSVICPWHGWEFQLKTGACSFNPSIKQPVFKVKVENGEVFVQA